LTNKTVARLVLILCLLLQIYGAAVGCRPSQVRAYGEVFAEDFNAVGYDPPAGTSRAWPDPAGMVDSGPALQKAIDAVPIDGTLRFQHCRYLTNRTLVVSKPLTIEVTCTGDRLSYCGFTVNYGIVGIHLKAPTTVRGLSLHAKPRPEWRCAQSRSSWRSDGGV
jgi:hypothetical protein